jgi:hypothetical protein
MSGDMCLCATLFNRIASYLLPNCEAVDEVNGRQGRPIDYVHMYEILTFNV